MLGSNRQSRTEVQMNYCCRLIQCPATKLAIPMLVAWCSEITIADRLVIQDHFPFYGKYF